MKKFEAIFKKVMGKKEPRPFDEHDKKDGNWNFIHSTDVSDAMCEVRELIKERDLLIEALREAATTAFDRGFVEGREGQ